MATDYDAPRKTDDELAEDCLEELKAQRANKAASAVDVDEVELAENLELPGADLSDESLTVRVIPRQADEFTCSKCFLVHHRSQLAKEVKGEFHLPRLRLSAAGTTARPYDGSTRTTAPHRTGPHRTGPPMREGAGA